MKYHVVETTDPHAFEKIERELSRIPGGVELATRSVLKRAQSHLMTQVYHEIPKEYAIKYKTLREIETKHEHKQMIKKMPLQYFPGQGSNLDMIIRGANISLPKFTNVTHTDRRKKKVVHILATYRGSRQVWPFHPSMAPRVHALKDSSPTFLNKKGEQGAFFAEMQSGHQGIWERIGDPADPRNHTSSGNQKLNELTTTALPKMVGNEKVLELVSKDYQEVVDKRAEHEIKRILNGWGIAS